MTKTALTIGKFNGFHQGHQLLIKDIVSKADEMDPVILKLDIGGTEIFSKSEQLKLLKTEFPQLSAIEEIKLSKEFMSIEPEEFVSRILVDKFHTGFLAVGRDFRFGKDRAAGTDELIEMGRRYGFTVDVIDKLKLDDEVVSSSRIKQCLADGRIAEADRLLGREYILTGVVESGKHLGRSLGFPTINLEVSSGKLLPKYGVYASKVDIGENSYKGITNIGIRPSMDDGDLPTVETFIYDFDGDIYGTEVTLTPVSFIREERHFETFDMLIAQIKQDIEASRRMF